MYWKNSSTTWFSSYSKRNGPASMTSNSAAPVTNRLRTWRGWGYVGGHPATPAGRRACVKFRDLRLEGAGKRQFGCYPHPGAALDALNSSLTQTRNLRELPLRPLSLPAQLPNIVSDRLSLRLAHFGCRWEGGVRRFFRWHNFLLQEAGGPQSGAADCERSQCCMNSPN